MKGYTIEPWDNEFSFEITNPKGEKHWVRLDELYSVKSGAFNSECTCYDFMCRCHPRYNDNGQEVVREGPGTTRCKHIRLCLQIYAEQKILKPRNKNE